MTSDEQAIHNLLFEYAERIDRGDLSGMARMFEHAEYGPEGAEPARDWHEVEKRNRDLVILYEDGTPRTQHVTSNVWLEVDAAGASAKARSRFTVMQAMPGGGIQAIVMGRYHDRFVKVDGRWRFAARRFLVDYLGDLSGHLRLG